MFIFIKQNIPNYFDTGQVLRFYGQISDSIPKILFGLDGPNCNNMCRPVAFLLI